MSLQTFFYHFRVRKREFLRSSSQKQSNCGFWGLCDNISAASLHPNNFWPSERMFDVPPSARSSPRPQQRTHIDSRTRSMPGAPLFGKSTSRKFTLALCHQNSPSRQTNARWRVDESTAATFRQAPTDTRSEEKRSNQLDACGNK